MVYTLYGTYNPHRLPLQQLCAPDVDRMPRPVQHQQAAADVRPQTRVRSIPSTFIESENFVFVYLWFKKKTEISGTDGSEGT